MTHLSEYLAEGILSKKTGMYKDAGLGLTKFRTIDEVISALNRKTPETKLSFVSYKTDRILEGLYKNSDGEFAWMYRRMIDGLRRPVYHYNLYVVKPKEDVGYLVALHDVPKYGEKNEGVIPWNKKDGTRVEVWNLSNMVCELTLDDLSKAAEQERLKIIDSI